MIPYALVIGEKYTYFLYNRYKFIKNDNIEEGSLLNATNYDLDLYNYHVQKCGVGSYKKLDRSLIHTCWPDQEEDDDLVEEEENEDLFEVSYANGNDEGVKIFNQKCVICLKRDSVYPFRQCGHQCICEQCYQNKGDIDILKSVVCRT